MVNGAFVGVRTPTTEAEEEVVESVQQVYAQNKQREAAVRLGFAKHIDFSSRSLRNIARNVSYLDASRTWLSYWMLNSLDILGVPIPDTPGQHDPASPLASKHVDPADPAAHSDIPPASQLIAFLRSCFVQISPTMGGFGGGPNQIPHLAPTYSATLALMTIGTEEAYEVLASRKALLREWFLTLKNADGSCVMHHGGEIDVRACYCMMLVAVTLGIDDDEVREGVAEFVGRCQTYEGGFSCQPYDEAHGGFTFCSTACLTLMRRFDVVDLPRLRKWLAMRQAEGDGGFNGRTNKLIDACYSFWVGSAHAIAKAQSIQRAGITTIDDVIALDQIAYVDIDTYDVRRLQAEDAAAGAAAKLPAVEELDGDGTPSDEWIELDTSEGALDFDQTQLQRYLLFCCQGMQGGLRDKPGVPPDFYHTCYALAGLSISQNTAKAHHIARHGGRSVYSDALKPPPGAPAAARRQAGIPQTVKDSELLKTLQKADPQSDPVTIGATPAQTLVHFVNPVYNLRRERVVNALRYFHGRSIIPFPLR